MVVALSAPKGRKAPKRRNAVRSAPQPPATQKGWDRRNKLKAAMAKLLENQSYHSVRIGDLSKKAGIPASVFYHYFKSKEDLLIELLEELHRQFEQRVMANAPYERLFDGISSVTGTIFSMYEKNVGLIRALAELDEQGHAQKWEELTLDWQKLVATTIREDMEPEHADEKVSLAAAYALSGMCNAFAHAYFMGAAQPLRDVFPDPADAAAFVAQLWYRAIRLDNPSVEGATSSPFLEHLPAARLRVSRAD